MKKTTKYLVVAILLLVLVTASACVFEDAKSVEITSLPQTTFTQGVDTFDASKVMVKIDGKEYDLQYAIDTLGVEFSGVKLESVGTFKATITYQGFSVSFDYTVVAQPTTTDFAGGDGTESNPYLISNVDQLLKINDSTKQYYKKKNYYKLTNDIDMSGAKVTTWSGKSYFLKKVIGGFDGNNKKLYNINAGNGIVALCLEIEGASTYNTTIKNLTTESVGQFKLSWNATSKVDFVDVKTYGVSDKTGNNHSSFVTYAKANSTVNFTNCENHVNMFGTSKYAGFVAFTMTNGVSYGKYTAAIINFKNCVNYGNIQGQMVSGFLANSSNSDRVTFDNCRNEGKLYGTNGAGAFVYDKETPSGLTDKGETKALVAKGVTAAFDANGQLVVKVANANVTKIVASMTVPVKATNYTDRPEFKSEEIEAVQGDNAVANFFNTKFATNTDITTWLQYDETNGQYNFNGSKYTAADLMRWTLNAGEKPYIIVYVFGANGEFLGAAATADGIKLTVTNCGY